MTLLLERSAFFSLVGHLLIDQPSREVFECLSPDLFIEIPFEDPSEELLEGAQMVSRWLLSDKESPEANLNVVRYDWLKLFAGTEKVLAAPWGSIYRSGGERLIFQQETLEVRRWYRRYGFQSEKLGSEPDDHIGLELVFLSHLIDYEYEAQMSGDEKKAEMHRDDQLDFLSHLDWSGLWKDSVLSNSTTDYLKGIALLTHYGVQGYRKELENRAVPGLG